MRVEGDSGDKSESGSRSRVKGDNRDRSRVGVEGGSKIQIGSQSTGRQMRVGGRTYIGLCAAIRDS